MLTILRTARFRYLSTASRTQFQLPSEYKRNPSNPADLPFSRLVQIWWRSRRKNRLEELEKELVQFVYPQDTTGSEGVTVQKNKVPIDNSGNYINEVNFHVINDVKQPTKHVVLLHGYGASLGCFARNFCMIDKYKGLQHNYKLHFLDCLSAGLSSDPKIPGFNYKGGIPKMKHITMHDNKPTVRSELYQKYYKLIEGYDFHELVHRKQQQDMFPALKQINAYYSNAIEGWRKLAGIEQIDFLVGHSFGGYCSALYVLAYPDSLKNLVLLSPVGLERHAFALTAPVPSEANPIAPSLDPLSHKFLSRFPIVLKYTTLYWHHVQPYLPWLIRYMGPWGVRKFWRMWRGKLYGVNKVVSRIGEHKVFSSNKELVIGTEAECQKIFDYLYNSFSHARSTDIHVKYLLTPAITSRWPIYDKFASAERSILEKFNLHVVYGEFDFMNSEAGAKMVKEINEKHQWSKAHFHTIAQGGHNVQLQNPFGTNELIHKIVMQSDKMK